ncbi:MAG: SDR family oxidoreductase [Dehalococcoidia bacterium]
MAGSLTGRVALVTGGAGLIGSAISRRLAADGAQVVINGRDAAKAEALAVALRQSGGQASVHVANVRDEAEVGAMVEATITRFGSLDILINNAGGVGVAGAGFPAYLADTKLDDWNQVVGLNLTASFLCTRASLPAMVHRGFGRVVNISSAGQYGVIGLAHYAAAKAGLIGLTKTVALEYAAHGITANIVSPHLTESGRPRAPMAETLLAQVPIKRYGQPDEIAGAVAYLVGPDAGYVTGQVLNVMGGLDWLGPTIDMPALRKAAQPPT